MRNLAGDERCDHSIRDELEAVGVTVVESEPNRHEVNARLTGQLGPFTFRRAWYYWIVEGPVPLAVAEELYADPVGRTDVRIGGHCGCPAPGGYGTRHFDADGKVLRPKSSDDYRLLQDKPWSESMCEILAEVEARCHFVDDPKAEAARSIVESYHIDSAAGLRLFVDTVRKYGLASLPGLP